MSNEPITITDTATPYLNFIAETKPDWMRKALKSTGWMMQKEIKQGIRSGAPGGRKYPNFMAPARRAAFESAFGAKLRKAYQSGGRAEREAWGSKSRNALLDMGISARTIGYSPLGKLSNAVGYQYDKGKQSVRVGWLSNSAKRLVNVSRKDTPSRLRSLCVRSYLLQVYRYRRENRCSKFSRVILMVL